MKKLILILTVVCLTNIVSYWFGSTSFIICKDEIIHYNTKEALDYEREISYNAIAGLHIFYSNSDIATWYKFMETDVYNRLDSLMYSDWEDFYYYDDDVKF